MIEVKVKLSVIGPNGNIVAELDGGSWWLFPYPMEQVSFPLSEELVEDLVEAYQGDDKCNTP